MAAAGPGTRRIMLRWPLVLAVVLLLVGAAGFAAPFTFAKSGSHDSDGQEITSRAKDFAATYNTYSYDDLDDYQKRMKSLLTDSYNEQFVEITNALFPTLKKARQSSGDPKVLAVALKSLGSNSATVLVAVDAKITTTDAKDKRASTMRHFRWELTFKKADGQWLIDDFQSVPTMDAELDKNGDDPGQSSDQKEKQ